MHLVGECLVEQGEDEGEGEHEFDDPGLPADGHGEAQDLASGPQASGPGRQGGPAGHVLCW